MISKIFVFFSNHICFLRPSLMLDNVCCKHENYRLYKLKSYHPPLSPFVPRFHSANERGREGTFPYFAVSVRSLGARD